MKKILGLSTLVAVVALAAVMLTAQGCTDNSTEPSKNATVQTPVAAAPATVTAPAMPMPTAAPPAAGGIKVVNKVCPVMDKAVDQDNVPPSLVRDYKGQKIGFCCGGCPLAWDRMSDAERDAALGKVMANQK